MQTPHVQKLGPLNVNVSLVTSYVIRERVSTPICETLQFMNEFKFGYFW